MGGTRNERSNGENGDSKDVASLSGLLNPPPENIALPYGRPDKVDGTEDAFTTYPMNLPDKVSKVFKEGTAGASHLVASAAVLIARVTGEDFPGDILIIVSNDAGGKNAVLLRVQVNLNKDTFNDILSRVGSSLQGSRSIPIKEIVKQVSDAEVHTPEILVHIGSSVPTGVSDAALLFHVDQSNGRGGFTFDADRMFIKDVTAAHHAQSHFTNILEAAVMSPQMPVGDVEMLADDERELLTSTWMGEQKQIPKCGVHHLLERTASRTPKSVAMRHGNEEWTYEQVNNWSNRLARRLRSLGASRNVLVGVFLNRQAELLPSLLGVLKSGAAYVPLDPVYPRDRIAMMLEDSAASIVVTSSALAESVRAASPSAALILVDGDASELEAEGARNLQDLPGWSPSDLCYTIFTSGSTGRPKGVQIRHVSWVNLILAFVRITCIGMNDALLAVTTVCFDIAGLELLMPLAVGATVHVAKREEASDASQLMPLVEEKSHITFMQATPATWRMLTSNGWEGNSNLNLLCGGEPLPPELATQLSTMVKKLLNVYGPTETTIWSTYSTLDPGHTGTVSIGKPIDNTTVYILDARKHLVPVGIAGELWIGGAGLSPGYLGRLDLTKDRFVKSPFKNNEYIYKTGDLAMWRSDGTLECLGRLDHQVKIRGFRIELGEIEAILEQHERVTQAIVDARKMDNGSDELQLVAFVVPREVEQEGGTNESSNEGGQETAKDTGHDLEEAMQWGAIYDSAYATENAVNDDPTLNFSGYDNSYTPRQPHEQETIQEWVERTCDRIFWLRPNRAIEQGCGNGMILLRCAVGSDRYLGCDLSEQAVNYCKEILKQPRFDMPHVSVHIGGAHESEKFNGEMLDTNVCNGVSMYFPSADYLAEVIRSSIASIVPDGTFFLGDVRNARLLQHFHLSVQQYQSSEDTPFTQALAKARKAAAFEKEFLVDPELFFRMQAALPDIAVMSLDIKRGIHHSEFSMYRYDVTFKKRGGKQERRDHTSMVTYSFEEFHAKEHSIEKLRQRLQSGKPKALAVRMIPDERLAEEREMIKIVNGPEEEYPATIGEFRQMFKKCVRKNPGLEPEHLYQLGIDCGYTCEVFWSPHDQTMLDVLFVACEYLGNYEPLAQASYREYIETQEAKEWGLYTSKGNQKYADIGSGQAERLQSSDVASLRASLRENVPEYMVPKLFVSMKKMPMTQNGKVDRKALPKPTALDIEASAAREGECRPPATETQKMVASMWSELLKTPEIGLDDDFFELGGQSLLAMQLLGKIKNQMGVSIGLTKLTEYATLEAMSRLIDGDTDEADGGDDDEAEPANIKIVKQDEMPYSVSVVPSVQIPVNDGTRLSARLWLPEEKGGNAANNADDANAEVQFPAVIEVQPYRKNDGTSEVDAITFPYLAGHGYASVRVDARGCGDSDGDISDEYTVRHQMDAYECVQWAAKQPWCDGNVAIMGVSWGGFIALQVATLQPPNLKAIVSVCATDDRFADDMHYMGGSLLAENLSWGSWMLHTASQPPDPASVGPETWLSDWRDRLEGLTPPHSRWVRHGKANDAYWQTGSVKGKYDLIRVPAFVIGAANAGGYQNSTPRLANNLKNAPVRAMIGPWSHNYPHASPLGPQHGFLQDCLDWFGRHLCGSSNNTQSRSTGDLSSTSNAVNASGSEFSVYVMRPSSNPKAQPSSIPGIWLRASSVDDLESHVSPPVEMTLSKGNALMPGVTGSKASTGTETISGSIGETINALASGDNDAQYVGSKSNRWFTFGNGPDMPIEQSADDSMSLTFDTQSYESDMFIIGTPTVTLKVPQGNNGTCAATSDGADRQRSGHIIARMCAVSEETNTSTRLSYGVAQVNGAEEVHVKLNYTCTMLPKGYRLRLAFSRDYWPIVWPPHTSASASKPLDICTGASKASIPMGDAGSKAAEEAIANGQSVEHEEVHLSEPLSFKQVRQGNQTREQRTREGAITMERTDDHGARRLPSDLVLDSKAKDTFEISGKNGPGHTVEWVTKHSREGNLSTETKVLTRMRYLNHSSLSVHTHLLACHQGCEFFNRSWSDTFPLS